jgi:hypothetical protein
MDSFPKTFTALIETSEGKSFQHPWHLGTIEPIARYCITYIYESRLSAKFPVLTIALKFDGHIIDVFDGEDWQSDILNQE